MTLNGGERMQIGEAAALTGLDVSTIRFYEERGVLPAPARTATGYRDYQESDVELMWFVRRLRTLELPLDDIAEIVALRTAGRAPCAVVRDSLAREAAAVEDRIAQLRKLGGELRRLQKEADQIRDDWPTSCVCHVVAGAEDMENE